MSRATDTGRARDAEAAVPDPVSPSSGVVARSSPEPPSRWAGRFRRLEHRRDESYESVEVAVCGAVVVSVAEWVRLLRCATCFPVEG
ncbi:hypothetical protein FHR81_001127 [Actinoalloteichus hoggarensis]|uniref:hypothetical protein n=1 Tax=Actinoalloteichus hoggarensis TaxID=1470176 RepID=UPI0012FD85E8|nr:hypothetical protein [Actinoalloteichus hoggarensis]MBB5920097.1 hypothetical protein [Actinoalloteichus hoggarensis]